MSRPAFSLCLCPDSHLLRRHLDALLAAHPPGEKAVWQRFVFWGDEEISPAFWEHLSLQPLFAIPKALIFRHIQALPAQDLRRLSAALLPLAEGRKDSLTWPLLCLEVVFDRGKPRLPAHLQHLPLYLAAQKNGWLDLVPGLTPAAMPAHIRAEAPRHGLKLTPGEIGLLARGLPPDAGVIQAELARLAFLADGDGRLPQGTPCGQAQAAGIYDLLPALQRGGEATAIWRRIREDRGGNTVFAFIAQLLREARLLWQSLFGPLPAFLSPQAAEGKRILARSLGAARLARIWDLALQADKGIKSGERNPAQAFEMLSAELFLLFRGSHDPPGT
ncbi:MAG: DNA polymerase III subunit delta [Desulfovibrio sp.]|jgi:DNA polymerase-3 subunit delta|nr:DNA polymerase III subunit delta [Desulfovibrio sp.]